MPIKIWLCYSATLKVGNFTDISVSVGGKDFSVNTGDNIVLFSACFPFLLNYCFNCFGFTSLLWGIIFSCSESTQSLHRDSNED